MFHIQTQIANRWVDAASTTNFDVALNIARHYSPSQVVSRVNSELGIVETIVSSPLCEACH